MNTIKNITISALVLVCAGFFQSCDESWLDPIVKSKIVVENTLKDYDDMNALVFNVEKTFRDFYLGYHYPLGMQMTFSDVSINPTSRYYIDWDKTMTPTEPDCGTSSSYQKERIYIWTMLCVGLRYAGTIGNRIYSAADNLTEEQKNELLGHGHFYRAFFYYMMVNEFGDVPWMPTEASGYKSDFMSYDRWSILEAIEKEAKFAWDNLPEVANYGRANKWAAGVLYMKILMSNQKWEEAIEVGKQIITARPLVTTRLNASYPNLQLDLHSVEAKTDSKNTENLFCVVNTDELSYDQAYSPNTMGMILPNWTNIRTPEGKNGTASQTLIAYRKTEFDNGYIYGLGSAWARPSDYTIYEIWTDKEANDERGRFNHDSWKYMEDLYFNTRLAGSYLNTHLIKPVFENPADTLTKWYPWPHYKCYVRDENINDGSASGGARSPRYVFRTAEVYLLLAECCYWKGDLSGECEYLNPVRARAKAEPYTTVTGISEILAERDRELFFEEFRHDELVRIAMTYAKTGKKCEATGYSYTIEKFSGNGGENEMLKEKGYNFFYDWMYDHLKLRADAAEVSTGTKFSMSVHHALWPIPEQFIIENIRGTINQTPGYSSVIDRIQPLKIE